MIERLNPTRFSLAEEIPKAISNSKGLFYTDRQLTAILGFDLDQVVCPSSDLSLAVRLSEISRKYILYCEELGGWFHYEDFVWKPEGKGSSSLFRYAALMSKIILEEAEFIYRVAGKLSNAKDRQGDKKALENAASSHAQFAVKTETLKSVRVAVYMVRPFLEINGGHFEDRPWRIGFENGVWNKSQLKEHSHDDYLLCRSPVTYLKDRVSLLWLALLNRISDGDAEFSRSLQDLAGYIISGCNSGKVLPLFIGKTGAGKTTFSDLLLTMLGKMGSVIDPENLRGQRKFGYLGESLLQTRFAVAHEVNNLTFDTELLKVLSGGDRLIARKRHGEPRVFSPTHTLVMISNKLPNFPNWDDALRSRIRVFRFQGSIGDPSLPAIEFERSLIEDRQNPDSELVQGFCTWVMEGAERVFRNKSIYLSPSVLQATAEFNADQHGITEFWLTLDRRRWLSGISLADLREEYEKWCGDRFLVPLPHSSWRSACADVGLVQARNSGQRFWRLAHPQLYPTEIGEEAGNLFNLSFQ